MKRLLLLALLLVGCQKSVSERIEKEGEILLPGVNIRIPGKMEMQINAPQKSGITAKVLGVGKCDLLFSGGYNSQTQFKVTASELDGYLQKKLPDSQKRQVTLSNGHTMNVLENREYAVIHSLNMMGDLLRGSIEVCKL